MSIGINAKSDFSYLFSGLGGSGSASSSANLNFLSDYMSIKNGSYTKLMKAYYGGNSSSAVSSLAKNTNSARTSALTKEETQALTKVQSTTDKLKESADALLATGSKSVFNQKDITTKDENGLETTTKGYDRDAIYNAVNSFVKDYNSVVSAVNSADNASITSRAQNMVNSSLANEKMLNNVGISIKDDGTLSIDKDTFNKADVSKIKTLFQGAGSFGYQTSAQASMVNYAADNAASRANTYTGTGTYGNAYNSGNLFSSYF